MNNSRLCTLLICVFLLAACEKTNQNEWANLDYSRIARENYQRENDRAYTPPTVAGCVDDDLYNCSGSGGRYR